MILRRPFVNTVRGFTLIEMLVSVALFSIVMTIVAAAYLNLINLDRQTHATNDIVNNLNFAVDSIARTIRTGTVYSCGSATDSYGDCPTVPGTAMSLTNDQSQSVAYILNTTTHQIGTCATTVSLCNSTNATYLTDPRIKINTLSFYVSGNSKTDGLQPQVVIVIQGTLAVDPAHAPVNFTIETSATQRGVDI